MGQTSPAQTVLNQRMVELIRKAVENAPSVSAAATAAGIPRTTLQNIISPEGRPVTVDQATRLAVALGVEPATWFDELRALALELGATAIAGAGAVHGLDEARAKRRPAAGTVRQAARRPRKKPEEQ